MTNPNVTARHARNAIGLLTDGVCANIDVIEDRVTAIDTMTERLIDVQLPTWISRAYTMISDMQAMLGDSDCPNIIRELLTKYDLNP